MKSTTFLSCRLFFVVYFHYYTQLISLRGKNFRESFSRLGGFRVLTKVPFMELTVTAPADVEATILSSLHMCDPVVVNKHLDRPNIFCQQVKLWG